MIRNPVAKVRLYMKIPGWKLDGRGAIARWLEGELLREGRSGLIHLVLVDDEKIEALNEQYLGHTGPTDVISFDLLGAEEKDVFPDRAFEALVEDIPESEAFPTGEVYVSLVRALEQAREYGVPVTDEVSRLALHGMLHLAGWDDSREELRRKMSVREDEGLSRAKAGEKLLWELHGPHDGRQ
ncbi:MAG: rRNA maturation RNase YbeY [bacterium]